MNEDILHASPGPLPGATSRPMSTSTSAMQVVELNVISSVDEVKGNEWVFDETAYEIIPVDIVGDLPEPSIRMQGLRWMYKFDI